MNKTIKKAERYEAPCVKMVGFYAQKVIATSPLLREDGSWVEDDE